MKRAAQFQTAGTFTRLRKQKRTGMFIEIAPFAPSRKRKRSAAEAKRGHTLGERKALLMALLSKVLLRYF